VYCYAQDVTRFEMSRCWGEVVEVKVNIVTALKKELAKGHSGVYGIGTVTDPYQPLEEKYELTRGCLRLLRRAGAEVSILTKSSLVLRDLDLLKDWTGAEVGMSIGCFDDVIASRFEPGVCPPSERLRALASLVRAGVPTYIMAAPILPGIGDSEAALSRLIGAASDAGVKRVMWDKYNPKPMAGARMKRAMSSLHSAWPPAVVTEHHAVRAILERECRAKRIELVDAF
jgi:DNA repair photolyase